MNNHAHILKPRRGNLEFLAATMIADVVTGKLDVREAASRLPEEVAELENEVELEEEEPAGEEFAQEAS